MSINKPQIHRVMDLYTYLPRNPQAAQTIEQLHFKIKNNYAFSSGKINSIKKNIQRDLELLNQIVSDGEVECIRGGRFASKYRLSEAACLEHLKPELALVLIMAKNYLKSFLPQSVYEHTEGFFIAAEAQLENSTQLKEWSARMQFVPSGYSGQQLLCNDAIQEPIYQAILGERWISAIYMQKNSKYLKKYILVPHGVIHHENTNYLIATKVDESKRTQLSTFNMKNFKNVSFTEEQVSIDIDNKVGKIIELVENREFECAIYDRCPQNINFIFHRYLLNFLEENPLSIRQEIIILTSDNEIDEYRNHQLIVNNIVITHSLIEWFNKYRYWIDVIQPSNLYDVIDEYYMKNVTNEYN
ncbi:WYL domain-containing protein [Acinetobacter nectaris]|uniref:WYL domain-containing protein n=1 Tax=Acinetobacter nectaris TaxID=1219382 RepID=UPI001F1F3730|nr:WYL domain-containing protein [Acinetobacter nectaris]MCF8998785.1 WYL domain-containing protein [Acinetobacter nectaris]MCF9027974.1 WYL domain-containing protein [Acinetobacter nectaris]